MESLRVSPTDPDSFEINPEYKPETLKSYVQGQAFRNNPSACKTAQGFRFTTRAKFLDDLMIGVGSGVHLGGGVVATAGHVMFEELGIGITSKNLANFYVVFSLTDDLVHMDIKIPKRLVFKIERCVPLPVHVPASDWLTNYLVSEQGLLRTEREVHHG